MRSRIHATAYVLALATALLLSRTDTAMCMPGDVLWDNTYTSLPGKDSDRANGVAVDSNGDVLVTGCVSHLSGDYDILTLKYAPDGKLGWDRLAGETWRDIGRAVITDPAGNIIVAGESDDPDNPSINQISAYYTRYHVIKYDPSGERLEESYASGYRKDSRPSAVAVDDEGGIYVTGYAQNAPDTYPCWYTVKFEPDGGFVYEKVECYGSDAAATGIGLERSGAAVVCGYYKDLAAGNYNIRVVKYAPDGLGIVLDETYNHLSDDEKAWAVAVDDKSDVVVTGETSDQGGTALTLKYTPRGDLLWAESRRGSSGASRGNAVAVDGEGRVYVAGKADKEDQEGGDFLLLIYDSCGRLLLDRTYPTDGDCDAKGIAVCPDGSIVIAGDKNTDDQPTVAKTMRLEGFRHSAASAPEAPPVVTTPTPEARVRDLRKRLFLRGGISSGRFLQRNRY